MQAVKMKQIGKLDYRSREAYKTLRTNIELCGSEHRVIGITSCTPNEGKSSIAMNLAYAFAEAGKKVILIDADLRKSVLVGRYRAGNVKVGLTHYLVGQADMQESICTTESPNMFIMFAGPVPPNPSELLGSKRFHDLIEKLRQAFDYIIVDTPPLGSVIDSAVAAKVCDGMALVIESNTISYKFAQRVKEQLEKTDCRILGVILNKVDLSSKGYYGNYGHYYGKYYGQYYGKYGEENG
ncbi:MAG: CpsD/CapB family tyrosine-protein kinase [Fusicatenibacter sp.]|nr:CpsD/CapB family tyrosine-protein kinase [Lachnospiraceae bacterium]MDY2938509.1 CpsD/CapB family tyrosine-protein kinase [Fusicatenibacter sp.]